MKDEKKQQINALIEANFKDFAMLWGAYKIKEIPSYNSLKNASQKYGPRFRRQVEAIISKNKVANFDGIEYGPDPDIEDPIIGMDGEPIETGDSGGGFNVDEWLNALPGLFDKGVNIWKKYQDAKNYDPNAGGGTQPPPNYPPPQQNAGISQQTMLIGGGFLALILIVLIFKK